MSERPPYSAGYPALKLFLDRHRYDQKVGEEIWNELSNIAAAPAPVIAEPPASGPGLLYRAVEQAMMDKVYLPVEVRSAWQYEKDHAAAARPETTAGEAAQDWLTPEWLMEVLLEYAPKAAKLMGWQTLKQIAEALVLPAAARASSGTRPDIEKLVGRASVWLEVAARRIEGSGFDAVGAGELRKVKSELDRALAAATPAVTGAAADHSLNPRKMAHLNTIWEPWTDSEGKPLVCGICKQEIPQCEQGYHGDGKQSFHECCSYQQQIAELKLAAAVPADEGLREALTKLCDKLDLVHDDSKNVFLVAAIHGCKYDGANWKEEYDAARAALAVRRETPNDLTR